MSFINRKLSHLLKNIFSPFNNFNLHGIFNSFLERLPYRLSQFLTSSTLTVIMYVIYRVFPTPPPLLHLQTVSPHIEFAQIQLEIDTLNANYDINVH